MSASTTICLILSALAPMALLVAMFAPLAMRIVLRPHATLVLRGKSGPKRRRRVARTALASIARKLELELGIHLEEEDALTLAARGGLVDLVVRAEPVPRTRRVRIAFSVSGLQLGAEGAPIMEAGWVARVLVYADDALGVLPDVRRIDWRCSAADRGREQAPASDTVTSLVRAAPFVFAIARGLR